VGAAAGFVAITIASRAIMIAGEKSSQNVAFGEYPPHFSPFPPIIPLAFFYPPFRWITQ